MTHQTPVPVRQIADNDPWDCPHDPHCGARSTCDRLVRLAAAKAEQAGAA